MFITMPKFHAQNFIAHLHLIQQTSQLLFNILLLKYRMSSQINRTIASESKSIIPKTNPQKQEHIYSLKQSVLDQFDNLRESELNREPKSQLFLFETLAMLIYGYGLFSNQKKQVYFQSTAFAMIGVCISARLSGANMNPAITLSNCFRKENKYQLRMLPVYFFAQVFGALLGMTIAELLDNGKITVFAPDDKSWAGCFRVVLSEAIGTFILVFFVLQISNPNTTFIDTEMSGIGFITTFIYIGRKLAPSSHSCINMSIVVASALVTLSKGDLNGLKYCGLWIVGEILGVVIATIFYDKFLEPNVQHIRKLKRQSQNLDYQSLVDYDSVEQNEQYSSDAQRSE